MAVYKEEKDGSLTIVVEDVTKDQIEANIKECLNLDSTCGKDILSSISKKSTNEVTI